MSTFLPDALTKIGPGRLMFAVLVLSVFFYIYHELSRDVLIIDPFTVPKQFEEAGLSSEVMTNRIGDKLRQTETATVTQMRRDNLMSAQENISTPDMEIPGTKLGLKTVVEMTRNVFGIHPKHVGGDIVFPMPALTNDESPSVKNQVTVSVYVTRGPSQISATSFMVQGSDLNVLVQRTAEVILEQVNPYVFAVYLTSRNEYEKAVEIIQGLIQNSSDDRFKGDAFDLWGNALQLQKKYDEAIVKYQKAIEIDPEFATAYSDWGTVLQLQKRYDEAIVKYQKAIEINPEFAIAYSNWGETLQLQKRYDEAIVKYQKAVQFDPKDAWSYRNWGEALREQKKYEEAIVKYQKAIEIDPKDAMAYNNWGEGLREQKKYDEAIVKYQKAIEIYLKYDEANVKYLMGIDFDAKNALAMAYANWGEALREQKEYDEAIVKYQKAIQIDPKNADAYYGLSRVLSAREIR